LKITGDHGSSIFIAIIVISIIGKLIMRNIKEKIISKIRFQTLHQFSIVVFFISIAGIALIKLRVVFEEVISK
jgi:hypothetical protein